MFAFVLKLKTINIKFVSGYMLLMINRKSYRLVYINLIINNRIWAETPFLMHHSYHSPTEDNIISTNLSLSVSRDLRTKRREVKFSSNFPPLVFIKNKLISSFSFLFLFTSSSYHYFFILFIIPRKIIVYGWRWS